MAQTPRNHRRRKKLNLTVTDEYRRQAEELAARQHRSISNLFEHLLDMEIRREARAQERERSAQDPPVRSYRDDAVVAQPGW